MLLEFLLELKMAFPELLLLEVFENMFPDVPPPPWLFLAKALLELVLEPKMLFPLLFEE